MMLIKLTCDFFVTRSSFSNFDDEINNLKLDETLQKNDCCFKRVQNDQNFLSSHQQF